MRFATQPNGQSPAYSLRAYFDKTRGPLRRDTLGQVLGHRDGLAFFDLGVEERRVPALGELPSARSAPQVAYAVLAVDLTHAEISSSSFGVEVAIFVGTG